MLKMSSLAALVLGLVAAPAAAASPVQGSVIVSYADLNLTSNEGRQSLDRRLAVAASKVCGGGTNLRLMRERAAYRICLAETTDSYKEQQLAVLEAANSERAALATNRLIAVRVNR